MADPVSAGLMVATQVLGAVEQSGQLKRAARIDDQNANQATLKVSIRDFDRATFEARKARLEETVRQVAANYPRANVSCNVSDIYSNISNAIGEDRRAIDLIFGALAAHGIPPKVIPMRATRL